MTTIKHNQFTDTRSLKSHIKDEVDRFAKSVLFSLGDSITIDLDRPCDAEGVMVAACYIEAVTSHGFPIKSVFIEWKT